VNDDPAELIADAICVELNAAQDEEENPFEPFRFQATNPEDPNAELDKSHSEVGVYCWPHGKSEQKTGRGIFAKSIQVTLFLIRDVNVEVKRKAINALNTAILERLNDRKMAGFTYSVADTTLVDLEFLHEHKKNTVVSILTYIRAH
jgi:hypothetical protein